MVVRHQVILANREARASSAITDPSNIYAIDDVVITNLNIDVVVASGPAIAEAVEVLHSTSPRERHARHEMRKKSLSWMTSRRI